MYCNIQSAEGQKTKKQGAAKMKNSVIKRTEDYTENRKAYYRLPNSTTMEYHLISHLNHSEGAVLRKGERVFITDLCLKGFITGVYEKRPRKRATATLNADWT